MAEDWQNGGFGLYLHWPFCQAKCPYCDFNSHVSRKIDQEVWKQAYLAEIDRYAAEVPGRVLTSVFFGGGTPSLMDPDVVEAVLGRIRRHWPQANEFEVTLEANPGSVEAGRFRGYADAGVNRVSLGIQALNDVDLRRLGRVHSVSEALRAFEVARGQFDRVSFDLIYARQDQTLADWQLELQQALSLAIDHLSLYQLTIEQGTAFGDRYGIGKLRGLPGEDLAADMYQATQDLCGEAGLGAYEVSNHAQDGAESRHNRVYWRYGDYVGIGPGAHGRLTIDGQKWATEGWKNPTKWLRAVAAGAGESLRDPVSLPDQSDEMIIMGLRLTEGVDRMRYVGLAGRDFSQDVVGHLVDLGMIQADAGTIRATVRGRMVLNTVINELLTG